MMKLKIFLFALFMMCLASPSSQSFAQFATSPETTVQVDDSETANTTVEKKKKNDIDINEKFWLSLLINVASMLIIIILIYYPNNRRYDSIFTFIMFNLMIFMLTFVLNKIKLSMGAAFGLFAVFSMLRYRTEGISMKDMTYLFIFVGLGLISAIRLEYYELGIISGLVIVFTFLLDNKWLIKHESSKMVFYDNIELVKQGNKDKLLEDLRTRTGLKISRYDITRIDFLKDMARIRVYYYN
jgi:hypothetical protein